MLDMKRRKFLGISAATVAVVAFPALSIEAIGAERWPRIGEPFYIADWTDTGWINGSLGASSVIAEGHAFGLRRIEKIHGVHLGHYRREIAWAPPGGSTAYMPLAGRGYYPPPGFRNGAWFVVTQATVIGYA